MLLLTIFLRLVQKVSRVQIEITLLLVFVKIERGLKINKSGRDMRYGSLVHLCKNIFQFDVDVSPCSLHCPLIFSLLSNLLVNLTVVIARIDDEAMKRSRVFRRLCQFCHGLRDE